MKRLGTATATPLYRGFFEIVHATMPDTIDISAAMNMSMYNCAYRPLNAFNNSSMRRDADGGSLSTTLGASYGFTSGTFIATE